MSARTTSSAPVLAVRGLRVERSATILRGIDWTVRRGEHWVVLGPNGCGKTSLLAALTGYLMPTAGEIDVLGARFGRADWRDLRQHIGFVSNALTRRIESHETALEVVASGRHALINTWQPPSAEEARAALRLLRGWRCGALAERAWGVLSQGERQRVLAARALMARPPLLLLDEPCAGLDPVAREQMLRLVERQARSRRGPSIVLITHHVEEITPALSHALLLRRGCAVAAGPIADTLNEKNLSAVFGQRIRLRRSRADGRWQLRVATA